MPDLRMPETNTVILAGRLTRDPELRHVAGNRAVCNMSIANGRRYKDKSGEQQEKTTFADVTVWDKSAEWVAETLSKGRPVIVEGRLNTEEWEQEGQRRTKLCIVATRVQPLDWDGDKQQAPVSNGAARREAAHRPQPRRETPAQAQARRNSAVPVASSEDDIPF